MQNLKPWALLLFIPLLMCCGKTATTINGNQELTGKWQLTSMVQKNDTIKRPAAKQGLYDVSLTFKEKGELEATSSTNYLTGFYETSQLNSILLGGDGTERKETSWGSLFVNALPRVNIYDLKTNQLILFCDNNDQLIFNKAQ